MKLSKGFIGASVGGAMLALLNSGSAQADEICADVTIDLNNDITAQFDGCLSTEPSVSHGVIPTLPSESESAPRVINLGCEFDRRKERTTCKLQVPASDSCPGTTDHESRSSGQFPGTTEGIRTCYYDRYGYSF